MNLLIEYYNGYVFYVETDGVERVLNSNLVMYFLDEYGKEGKIPNKLADPNIRSDYKKLTSMFGLYKNQEDREQILQDIIAGKPMKSNIITNFSLLDSFHEEDFLTMLFYLGLLTIKGSGGSFDVSLETPNAVIRDVYYEYYARYMKIKGKQILSAIDEIAFHDDFGDFNQLVTQVLQLHSNDDFMKFDEKRLKSIFLACLGNQRLYLVKSAYAESQESGLPSDEIRIKESSHESSGKRPDIALLDVRGGNTQVKFNYLIELKYLKKSEAADAEIERARQEAHTQMQGYLKLPEFAKDARIKGFIYVVVKDEIKFFEEV